MAALGTLGTLCADLGGDCLTTDWISIPLVALPIVSSIAILAFVAGVSPAARDRMGPSSEWRPS